MISHGADDGDSVTDALKGHEDAPLISQSSHAQVMAGIESQTSTTP